MAPRNSPTGTWRNSNLDFTGNTLPVLRSSFAPTLRRGRKDLLPAPSYNPWVPPYPVPPGQSGKPYRDNWDVNRAVSSAFTKSVWVYRAVKAISDNAARIPVCFRVGDRWDGDIIDQHPLLDRFNYQTSPYEQAYIFRKRLSQQVLLNKQGAFIEVVRSNMGDPLALYLLPAGYTWPVPSEQTFVSAYRVQMPGKCVGAGTSIVTKRGTVAVEAVVVGDEVLTHLGRWRRVTGTSARPLSKGERVVEIKGKGMDALILTADHKIWTGRYDYHQRRRFIRMEWVPARELEPRAEHGHRPHDSMTVPVIETGERTSVSLRDYVHETKFTIDEIDGRLVSSHRNTSSVPVEVKLTHQLGRLLGLYLAEGWTSGSRGKSEMGWAFHEDEVGYQQEVVTALDEIFGLVAKVIDRPGKCRAVLVNSRLLANLFACGNARTKVLPGWAWNGDSEFFEGVLTGWADGDGHRRLRGSGHEVSVTTVSPSLAEHMRLIAVATGRCPGLTHRTRSDGFAESTSYELIWTEGSGQQMRRIDGGSMTSPLSYVRESHYGGLVYDLTIEDDHSFLTTGGIVHNSWFDIPAENVIWIREPHPTDPYSGLTPLECAGIDVEIDWYARLYNRNFLQNDGRPGGLLVLKGDVLDDDMDELRRRFLGPTGSAVMGAGRVSVIEGDQASFLDTASSPREAAYTEARETSGEQILMAFGVPESIAGNASDRTFENADQERENFWRETMLDHLSLIGNALDVLDPDPKIFYTFDLASVSVLQRDRITNLTFALQEVKGSVRTPNEYRAMTGELEPLGPDDGTGGADQLYMLTTEASITGGSVNPGMMQQITHGVTSAVSAALPAGFEAPALSAGTPGEAEHPSLAGASWRRSRVAAKSLDPIQIVNEESAEDDSGDNAALRAARLVANQAGILTPDSPSFPVHADHFAERGGAPQERQRYRQVDSKVASTAHTWAMVCFDPPEAVCDQLAEGGSEAAEVLHITLGVIPMTVLDTPAKIGMLQGAVAAFASSAPALSMRIAGLGRFHNEAPGTTDAVVALIDSVGITETRTRLAHALTSAGFAFDSTHGFTPHLTLSYLDGDDDDPVALPPTLTWVQNTITVAIDDDWTDYAFGGAAIDWKVYHLEPQK